MWSPTVKSYLRLYTTMDLKKLAGFLEVEPEELRSWLLVNKQRSRQTRWTENGLLDGEVVNANDLDYAMQGVCIDPEFVDRHMLTSVTGSYSHL
jgi:translation initiation factor 3 subunit L